MKPVHHRDPQRLTGTPLELSRYARLLADRLPPTQGDPFAEMLRMVIEIYELGRRDAAGDVDGIPEPPP